MYVRTDAVPIPHDVLFRARPEQEPADVEEIRRVRYKPERGAAARRGRGLPGMPGVSGVPSYGASPCVVM